MSSSYTFGALSAAAAVGLGAFGAHGLKTRFAHYPSDQQAYYLDVWKTASTYHLIHSVAMCVAPQMSKYMGWGPVSAKLFAAGITLFSGSLYALVLSEERKFGAIAPIGGLALIAGWIAMAFKM